MSRSTRYFLLTVCTIVFVFSWSFVVVRLFATPPIFLFGAFNQRLDAPGRVVILSAGKYYRVKVSPDSGAMWIAPPSAFIPAKAGVQIYDFKLECAGSAYAIREYYDHSIGLCASKYWSPVLGRLLGQIPYRREM